MSWSNKMSGVVATAILAFSMTAFAQQTSQPAAPEDDSAEKTAALLCDSLTKQGTLTGGDGLGCVIATTEQASGYEQKLKEIVRQNAKLPVDEITGKMLGMIVKDDCMNYAFAGAEHKASSSG
jgi:hypothetical protein